MQFTGETFATSSNVREVSYQNPKASSVLWIISRSRSNSTARGLTFNRLNVDLFDLKWREHFRD